jgi:hypothetical protein
LFGRVQKEELAAHLLAHFDASLASRLAVSLVSTFTPTCPLPAFFSVRPEGCGFALVLFRSSVLAQHASIHQFSCHLPTACCL